jgi:regulator of sigma E protease
MSGDIILALDDEPTEDFQNIQMDIARNMVSKVTVLRDGEKTDIYIDPKYIADILNNQLFDLAIPFTVKELTDESLNKEADILSGDKIIMIDSTAIAYVQDALPVLEAKAGQEITATILRDSMSFTLPLLVDEQGNIGVYFQIPNYERLEYSLLESIPAGCAKAYDATIGQIKDLRLLAKPSTGAYKSVGSIIAITDAMPQQWNWLVFINILAMISIILAVMNLLPIPALDGGRILFYLIEILRGKPMDPDKEGKIHMIGLILLLALMVLILVNDVKNIIF